MEALYIYTKFMVIYLSHSTSYGLFNWKSRKITYEQISDGQYLENYTRYKNNSQTKYSSYQVIILVSKFTDLILHMETHGILNECNSPSHNTHETSRLDALVLIRFDTFNT
jgi:hypothetical protein